MDPVNIILSGLISEEQSLFVTKRFEEKFMQPNERGQFTTFVCDELLPEFMIFLFIKQFGGVRSAAITQLELQFHTNMKRGGNL